ncbi:MAG: hypothetical protein NTV31_02685 [Bacteroidia bacterium]|nr:hypothetical protein [Bacteroidia bacterium]
MKTDLFFKKLLPFTLTLLTVIILTSCRKDNFPDPSTLPKGLAGSWVETSTRSDTIIFNSEKDTGILILQRGYEIRNGYRLPIIGSDGYKYIILPDSIRLMGGLSSVFFDKTFFFKYDEANLTINIGKFSQYIDTKKSTLTFRKIK